MANQDERYGFSKQVFDFSKGMNTMTPAELLGDGFAAFTLHPAISLKLDRGYVNIFPPDGDLPVMPDIQALFKIGMNTRSVFGFLQIPDKRCGSLIESPWRQYGP